MAVVITILVGIVTSLFSNEICAWLLLLPKYLVVHAARRLPDEFRDRYEEEWEADLLEIPGVLAKIIYSLGLQTAGRRIRGSCANTLHPMMERVANRIGEPLQLSLGLLPEPEGRGRWFIVSLTVNAIVLATFLTAGTVVKRVVLNQGIQEGTLQLGRSPRTTKLPVRVTIMQLPK